MSKALYVIDAYPIKERSRDQRSPANSLLPRFEIVQVFLLRFKKGYSGNDGGVLCILARHILDCSLTLWGY